MELTIIAYQIQRHMVHGSASLQYKIDPGEGRRPPIFLEMPIERKSASYSGLMEVAFSQHKLG
jgi:hypothetical protein